jgi:aromatic-L-amino-acid decarboxylase
MDKDQHIDALKACISDVTLDMDPHKMRQMGYQVIDTIVDHISGLKGRSPANFADPPTMKALLDEPMPEQPQTMEALLDTFKERVYPYAIHPDHPRFFGYFPCAGSIVGILADALASGTNFFAGHWYAAAGPSQVELVVLDWFKTMLGYPSEAGGLLVSGGSMANLTALTAARHNKLGERFDDGVLYLSEQSHASIERAARVNGFRQDQIRYITVDETYRLDMNTLKQAVEADRKAGLRPFCVVANAGSTNTGAVDPIFDLAAFSMEQNLWLHVDAAYGGFSMLSDRGRHLLRGIDEADSITLDPHKWLYVPFEAGCLLCKDRKSLERTFTMDPEYLQDIDRDDNLVNFCDHGIQLTRSFRALKIWMTLKHYGIGKFQALVDQHLDLALLATALFDQSPVLDVMVRPQLGVVCFRYIPETPVPDHMDRETYLQQLNEALVERIHRNGKALLSTTRLQNQYAIRFCPMNHRTTKEDIISTIAVLEQTGREVEKEMVSKWAGGQVDK